MRNNGEIRGYFPDHEVIPILNGPDFSEMSLPQLMSQARTARAQATYAATALFEAVASLKRGDMESLDPVLIMHFREPDGIVARVYRVNPFIKEEVRKLEEMYVLATNFTVEGRPERVIELFAGLLGPTNLNNNPSSLGSIDADRGFLTPPLRALRSAIGQMATLIGR